MKRMATAAWLGLALAAIFFYPLASALDGDPYYLQWQPQHSTETLVAIAIGAVVLAPLMYLLVDRTDRGGAVGMAVVVSIPLLSLGAGVSRQLPVDAALRAAWETAPIRYGIPLLVAVLLVALLAFRPAHAARGLRRLLLILSPVALVVLIAIIRAGSRTPVPIETLEAPHLGAGFSSQSDAERSRSADTAQTCPSIVALLFDELSFAYLYDGRQVKAEYPAFAGFAAAATNYLDVRSPGEETKVAVPGYLAGRAFDNVRVEGARLEWERAGERGVFDARAADGLFATARANGYAPEIGGYYFPYCDLLHDLATACRSFSFYNIATVRRSFSPMHPVMTTLILWPRQFPLGLLKNVPFARLQRETVEATLAFASRPLAARPVFRFVHFSIPHLPFVFTRDGYDPPFDPLRQQPDTAYVNQIAYADRVFGTLMDGFKQAGEFDTTTFVLFADHGFRGGGRETSSSHIPFIVKAAGQSQRVEIDEPAAGEELLEQLVAGCAPPGGAR